MPEIYEKYTNTEYNWIVRFRIIINLIQIRS